MKIKRKYLHLNYSYYSIHGIEYNSLLMFKVNNMNITISSKHLLELKSYKFKLVK
jgi:hypothetical protein